MTDNICYVSWAAHLLTNRLPRNLPAGPMRLTGSAFRLIRTGHCRLFGFSTFLKGCSPMSVSLLPRSSVRAALCPGVGLRVVVYNHWPSVCDPPSVPRGCITGFSSSSARRFREKLFSFEGDHGTCFSLTLTIRDFHSPDVWRRNLDVFSRRLSRRRDCGFWRVELQKRGTPHLHCLIWSDNISFVRRDWLQVWGVAGDRDHERHAIKISSFGGSAWLGYMAAHAIKHKRVQLGWSGRQWGVFCRSALRFRAHDFVEISIDQYLETLDQFQHFVCCPPWVCSWIRFCSDDTQKIFSAALGI